MALANLPALAVTNTVPWSESFEGYTNGTAIPGTNGWTAGLWNAGLVTNDASVVGLLNAYPAGALTFPLPGETHTNVMAVSDELVNHVSGATGGVVTVDFMALPSWSQEFPDGDTNDQYAFVIATNGLLTVWHHDQVQSPATNVWLTLTNSPVIASNAWHRFTITQDYSNSLYQVAVDQGTPLTDALGWQQDGVTRGGSWFRMVKTNGVLATLVTEASAAYVDDYQAARRSVFWSRSNYWESVTNNGGILATSITASLSLDTFTGTAGDDLAALGKFRAIGLPSNLVAVATLVNSTNVAVVLTNCALAHESADSLGSVVFQFSDSAFGFQRAADVAGYQLSNVAITFSNTPALGFSRLTFSESGANDGSIDNSTPMLITLTNGTFAGTVGEDFATNSLKLQVSMLPGGLTSVVTLLSSTQLQVRLTGNATQHANANDVSTLRLAFQAAAFNILGTPVSSVLNLNQNLAIDFNDPPSLSYTRTSFSETVTNNGTVAQTSTLTLVNKSFNAGSGEDMVANSKITCANVPAGLTAHIVRGSDASTATLSFSGAATVHEAVNSLSTVGVTLTDAALVGGNAAGVTGYSRSNLAIIFTDARILTYSSKSFAEQYGGLIDNRYPPTVTLSGDTLTGANGDDFVAAGKITVTGLPPGLTATATRDSSTQLSLRLTGAATSHASSNSVANVVATFADSAFTGLAASYVTHYQVTDLSVSFNDFAGVVNVLPFQDSFERYAPGLLLSGTNGWVGEYSSTAAKVTNTASRLALLPAACETLGHHYPIAGTHTQIMYLSEDTYNEVHSINETNVFVDFLFFPVPVTEAADSSTSDQYAFYVTTNGYLTIWQSNAVGAVNEWIALSNAPRIDTSAWVRVTIESNYSNQMYRIRLNEGDPVSDPRGWADNGAPTGSWFHMVQSSGALSRFKFTGSGDAYIDDFTVMTSLPMTYGNPAGTMYLFR